MLTKNRVKSIQSKIESAVKKIAEEEDVEIIFENCSYTASFYESGFKVITKDHKEVNDDEMKLLSMRVGFKQNIIGMDFTDPNYNRKFEIVDIRTRNRTYPIICKDLNTEKLHKFTKGYIKKVLGGDKIINRRANLKNITRD